MSTKSTEDRTSVIQQEQPSSDPWDSNPVSDGNGDGDGKKGKRRNLPPLPKPYELRTRPLSGKMVYPLIILTGEHYSKKTVTALQATNDERFGECYVLALGELVDLYGELARPDTQFVIHDGSWFEIYGAVTELEKRSNQLREAGEKPMYLIIDSGTKLWELLWTWVEYRATNSFENRRKLMVDRNANIDSGPNFWNPANRRHRQLVTKLLTMPAVVVITAREKLAAQIGPDGNPIPGAPKVSVVECQKELPYTSTVYVRLSRDAYPEIVGARRAHGGIRPGKDEPKVIDPRRKPFQGVEFSIPWLVFDALKFDPGQAEVPALIEPAPDAGGDDTMPTFAVNEPLPPAPPGADEAPGEQGPQVVTPDPAARRG